MSVSPVLVVAGGTGTGKSTVCSWLGARGAFVIDADRIGHEMLEREDILAALVTQFGDDVLDAEGRIDRKKLGPLAFATHDATQALNRIVHPPLVAEIERRIAVLRESQGARLIVVDAALYFQFEPRFAADAVLFTTVASSAQEARIRDRDGLTLEQAQSRLQRQSDLNAFQAEADAVLDTGSSPDAVRTELLTLVDRLFGLGLVESDPRP